jgi:Putative DNA-binding domain
VSLAALQRDFRSWLTVEAPEAAARFGERAQAGLAVYLNNYRGQLIACLAESFSAVRAWLGDAAFDSAAATHVNRRPPHSWTLDAYALEFPETIDMLYPEDREVGELARLERDLGLAFVGPDAESLDRAALERIDWGGAVLELVPTFSLLTVTTNAAALWSALHAGETPPPAAVLDESATIAIWRNQLAATFRTLEPMDARALRMVKEGRTFAEICAAVTDEAGEEEGPTVAGSLLWRWIHDGMIGCVRGRMTTA